VGWGRRLMSTLVHGDSLFAGALTALPASGSEGSSAISQGGCRTVPKPLPRSLPPGV
jgi:hypothetical protein